MLIDSSLGAEVPALVAQRSELFTFKTPSPRLLNRPISGAPGPRGDRFHANCRGRARSEATSLWRPLTWHAPGGRTRPLGVQGRVEPTGDGPRLLLPGPARACPGGRSPWVPAPLVADVWKGGRRPAPRWPGFGRDCFLEPVLPTAANSSR